MQVNFFFKNGCFEIDWKLTILIHKHIWLWEEMSSKGMNSSGKGQQGKPYCKETVKVKELLFATLSE